MTQAERMDKNSFLEFFKSSPDIGDGWYEFRQWLSEIRSGTDTNENALWRIWGWYISYLQECEPHIKCEFCGWHGPTWSQQEENLLLTCDNCESTKLYAPIKTVKKNKRKLQIKGLNY